MNKQIPPGSAPPPDPLPGSIPPPTPLPVPAPAPSRQPRLWLTPSLLQALQQRAAANSPAWVALKHRCDEYLTGTVNWPDEVKSPPGGNIGEGYQGSGYHDALLHLGLGYQTIRGVDPAQAALYAAKGVDILVHMSALSGPHAADPLRDSCYGIRFYGVGLAIGFDWFSDALTADQKQGVCAAANRWLDAYAAHGFGRSHPQGNYFAGYYAAKGLIALATEGDNPRAVALWDEWLNQLHGQFVQPYYNNYMTGGGWPEGWNYGPLATLNMIWPSLAARTAKALDLIHSARPFTFPVDQGLFLIHFAWPNRLTMDDRGALYGSNNPAATEPGLFTSMAGLLGLFTDPSAPVFHRFAREVRAGQKAKAPLWQEFLFWDEAAPEKDVHPLPLSYLARGMNMVSVRSSWERDAVWGSFTASPYIGNGGSGEEFYDQGSLAIVRGGTPFLVNANGALWTNSPGTNDGDSFEPLIYRDNYGDKTILPDAGNRLLYNVFYVKTKNYGQDAIGPDLAHTRVSRFEDRGTYCLLRGRYLEQVYRPDPATKKNPIAAWTRDIVYLRPKLFVVYDRTTTADATQDQWQAFHLIKTPLEVAVPSPGAHRFDVSTGVAFAGAVTTLLPVNHTASLVNVFNSSKVYRLEVRPGTVGIEQRWLTVFDAASSANQVAKATRLSFADGNVLDGPVVGTLLTGTPLNHVVLFSTGNPDLATTGQMRYTVPAQETLHVVTQMGLKTNYAVTVVLMGGNHAVRISPGIGYVSSANGVLSFSVDAAGKITAS